MPRYQTLRYFPSSSFCCVGAESDSPWVTMTKEDTALNIIIIKVSAQICDSGGEERSRRMWAESSRDPRQNFSCRKQQLSVNSLHLCCDSGVLQQEGKVAEKYIISGAEGQRAHTQGNVSHLHWWTTEAAAEGWHYKAAGDVVWWKCQSETSRLGSVTCLIKLQRVHSCVCMCRLDCVCPVQSHNVYNFVIQQGTFGSARKVKKIKYSMHSS